MLARGEYKGRGMKFGCLAAVLLTFAASGFAAEAKEAVSLTFQMNYSHDGNTSIKGFKPPLKVLWKTDLSGNHSSQVTGFPIIVNNKVYVVSATDSVVKLFALDIAGGAILWKKTVPQGLQQTAAIAYDNGRVFVINSKGLLQAYNADDGSVQWSHQLPGQVPYTTSAPLAADGFLFLSANIDGGGHFYNFDQATGDVLWDNFVDDGGADNTIAAYGHGGVFVSYTCNYYKFDPVTGHKLWADFTGGYGGGGDTPVLEGNRYYVRDRACTAGPGRILNAKNGNILGSFTTVVIPSFWRDKKGNALEIGRKFEDPYVFAFDPKTGKVPWKFAGDGGIEIPTIVIGNYVVAASSTGMVYLLDGKSGRQKYSLDIGSGGMTAMGAGDGALIVSADDSVVAVVPDTGGNARRPAMLTRARH